MPHEAILSDPRMVSALGVVLWCKVQGASPVPAGYGAVEVFIDFAEELKRTETNQCVKFTKAIARHTKIRDQNPSLGYICPGEPHERSSNAPKFEDRSQEETEWQEQGAREAAWKLAKKCVKIKGA